MYKVHWFKLFIYFLLVVQFSSSKSSSLLKCKNWLCKSILLNPNTTSKNISNLIDNLNDDNQFLVDFIDKDHKDKIIKEEIIIKKDSKFKKKDNKIIEKINFNFKKKEFYLKKENDDKNQFIEKKESNSNLKYEIKNPNFNNDLFGVNNEQQIQYNEELLTNVIDNFSSPFDGIIDFIIITIFN